MSDKSGSNKPNELRPHRGEVILSEAQQATVSRILRRSFWFNPIAEAVVRVGRFIERKRGGAVPDFGQKIEVHNYGHATGVRVETELLTNEQVSLIIRDTVSENNKHIPAIIAEANRRRC